MSKYGDKTHDENLDCVSWLEIGQAGYLLNSPRIINSASKEHAHQMIVNFNPEPTVTR